MKTWRLVSGILSIVITLIVFFQSNLVAVFGGSNKTEGGAGIIFALFLVAAGITSIATRKNITKGSKVALFLLYGIGAIIALASANIYKDLIVWGSWSVLCAVIALLGSKKNATAKETTTEKA